MSNPPLYSLSFHVIFWLLRLLTWVSHKGLQLLPPWEAEVHTIQLYSVNISSIHSDRLDRVSRFGHPQTISSKYGWTILSDTRNLLENTNVGSLSVICFYSFATQITDLTVDKWALRGQVQQTTQYNLIKKNYRQDHFLQITVSTFDCQWVGHCILKRIFLLEV